MPGLKVCAIAGCPTLTAGTRCAAHAGTNGHHLYKTQRWLRLRATVLAEQPFCICGCGLLSQDVDHVVPHRGDEALFFDRENCRGMARDCHTKKTRAGQ